VAATQMMVALQVERKLPFASQLNSLVDWLCPSLHAVAQSENLRALSVSLVYATAYLHDEHLLHVLQHHVAIKVRSTWSLLSTEYSKDCLLSHTRDFEPAHACGCWFHNCTALSKAYPIIFATESQSYPVKTSMTCTASKPT
jgi:hypothetical protein